MGYDIKSIIHLLVPHYLLITIASPITSFLIITGKLPSFEIIVFSISVSLTILGFNSANMVFDEHIDKINKPKRPIVSGKITKKMAMNVAILLYISAILIVAVLGVSALMIIIALQGLTLLYTHPLFYFKKYFWSSSIFGPLFYFILPFGGAYYISSSAVFPVFHFVFFTTIYLLISNSKDIEDMYGEEKHGISSIPLLIGRRNSARLIIGLIWALIIGSIILSIVKIIDSSLIIPLLISALIFTFVAHLFTKDVDEMGDKEVITHANGVNFLIFFVVLNQIIFSVLSL